MERGLLWLPLLAVFFGLAWSGWNEYKKVEFYKQWSTDFERHKYDIYAVLGQQGDRLTWGQPTRQGLKNPQTVTFQDIARLRFRIDNQFYEAKSGELPTNAKQIAIELVLKSGEMPSIRFTDIDIAAGWYRFLSDRLNSTVS